MKLKIVSDIILDPLIKELTNIDNNREIDFEYYEDLINFLQNSSKDEINKYNFIYLHFDCFFKAKESEYINDLLRLINNYSNEVTPIVFVSNAIADVFPNGALNNIFGNSIQLILNVKENIDDIINNNNIVFFDFYNSLLKIGINKAYNFNLGHLYQMPYTKIFLHQLTVDFNNFLNFYSSEEKKVIIVDCDNTLWGGIIGEDGIDSIICDLSAHGIIYYNLQKFLKMKKDEGFLLCICSKNNEKDVMEVFNNKNMPLTWDDFVIAKINWEDKHNNIADIAKELSLGADSFIFIDDSDFEINSVNETFPAVSTFKFTNDYQNFIRITENYKFRRKIISSEDLQKNKLYKEDILRQNEINNTTSFEEYLNKLQIKFEVQKNDENNFQRLSQMTEKTNQFNFNKKPYSVQDLTSFVNKEGGEIYSLKVSDKYGDYGIVGLMLVKIINFKAIIENILISCRVLGRRIEYNFWDTVINDLKIRNININEIKFTKTMKNKPAEEFYNKIYYGNKN
ncbi:MAG: HAD-IIIC family phosphatase [Ignavibacteriae bacterium]|nr:HAD-IIIC family phosphatase [Ignavibacteriota bacterium]